MLLETHFSPDLHRRSGQIPHTHQIVDRTCKGEDPVHFAHSAMAYFPRQRIATLSEDHQWIVASFTRTTGNVWSNPELTCQHVDPETSVAAGQKATTEVKILVLKGTLDDALRNVRAQRGKLR